MTVRKAAICINCLHTAGEHRRLCMHEENYIPNCPCRRFRLKRKLTFRPDVTDEQQDDIQPEPFEEIFIDGVSVGYLHDRDGVEFPLYIQTDPYYPSHYDPGNRILLFTSRDEAFAWIAENSEDLLPQDVVLA